MLLISNQVKSSQVKLILFKIMQNIKLIQIF